MKTKSNRLLALLLTLITVMGLFPTAAFALEQGDASTVTEKYINEADGREIATAQTSKSTEVKDPQTVVGYEYVSFSEVTEHIYAKEDLTYIVGYPNKTVRGERYLARSEAAAIFYRLYDGFYPELQRQMKSTTFSDVPTNAWYYTELELCYNVGIINGCGDGTFKPNDPVTRAEFATMAARFAELTNSSKAMFKDVSKDHWAYQAINAAAEAGWVKGYPDGTYRPETSISRAETVTLINRLRNRSITVSELKELGVKNPYTDLVETYWASAIKAIIAGTKALIAAIVAGGWVAVVVIIIICLIGLLFGSVFGIFFSGEDSGNGMTMQAVVREINTEYDDRLEETKNTTAHDVLEMSGSRAVWKEVLAVYSVKTTTDPDNGQEVATMDEGKKELLTNIFWEMNAISSRTESKTEIVITESDDGEGNIVQTETTVTQIYLYITVTHKTAEEMAD